MVHIALLYEKSKQSAFSPYVSIRSYLRFFYIAMVNKLLDLALMQDEIPASLREHYRTLSANGKDCISCRSCEKRCPFGVSIAERMKQAESVFA